jgi:DNA-binding transcriptional regulator YiaG
MIDLSKDWTGDDIKRMLEERGINQQRLAELLGVRVATVSDWVRGTVVPSRLASVALTYLDKDLAGQLKVTGG